MAEISIPWGPETLTVSLPNGWTVRQVAVPSITPAAPDWPERLAGALTRPEGTPPLGKLLSARPRGRVAIVVEDLTRHSPLAEILEIIFRELSHARVPPENIEIVFATGMHRPLTPAEADEKIGPHLAGTIRWRNNPWGEDDAYVSRGSVRTGGAGRVDVRVDRAVATADLRIIVASVSPHLQAGFGGGYKMLVPGCAHRETIRQLHLAGVPRAAAGQVGRVGIMRRLIDAAGAAIDDAAGTSFGVQYILDADNGVTAIAAGDVSTCQRMLAKQCAAGYGTIMDAPADVVIANAAPRDLDLWQSFKAIANTCRAVRRDGALICLSRCPAGINRMPTFSLPIRPELVRRAVRFLGADSLGSLLTRLVPRMSGDAAFFVRLALQVLERNHVLMAAATLAEAGVKLLGLPLYATPEEAFAAADELLGTGPKRVAVFPLGGVTYPIVRP